VVGSVDGSSSARVRAVVDHLAPPGVVTAGRPRSGDGRLVSATEAAMMLRVSKMQIYRMINDGRLTRLKIDGQYRIPVGAVHALQRAAGAEVAERAEGE
jgi:excisionase family DNA binding protein